MGALEDIIKQEIAQNGPMDLGRYMGLCLGHPEHGYYMSRDPFGREGDFTTAPEISQMFGEMIGVWLADTWMKMGSPSAFTLLECGPGRGTLMEDALRATKQVEGFHDALSLHLLECSPVLKEAQAVRLKQYDPTWHMTLESVASCISDSPVLILGNEFLDALPVRQLVLHDTGWLEKVVILDLNDTLRLGEVKADNAVKGLLPPLLIPPKVGDHVEVSLQRQCFTLEVANIIKKQGGNILFLDYGFMHSVSGDTLQAVKNHEFCNVTTCPGSADLTSHVNFAEISRLGMAEDMTVHGPVSQGDFLNRLGIGVRAQTLTQSATESQRRDIDAALKRLTGLNTKENEMGSLFKAIALSSSSDIELAGFA